MKSECAGRIDMKLRLYLVHISRSFVQDLQLDSKKRRRWIDSKIGESEYGCAVE